MKLAIFGATGRTGLPLVQQALSAGHSITALVRSPGKMTIQHPQLKLIQGDVMDAKAVASTIQDSDAVLMVLGHGKGTPPDMQTLSTRHIINAMRQFGVKRVISLTGAGVSAPEDQPKLINHLIKFALKTLSGAVLKDGEDHANLLRNSGLDWTIVRGPVLNEGPYTGQYRVGWVGVNTGTRISRADVADFMLKQLHDARYLHKMPMISD